VIFGVELKKAMKCKAVLKEIEELDAGVRPSAETNQHLLACASCSAFADERNALRLLVGSLDSVQAPPDFDWKLRARFAEARGEQEHSRGWLSGFAPSLKAITVAASITLLLVGLSIYRQMQLVNEAVRSAAVAANIKGDAKSEDKSSPVVNPQPRAPENAGSVNVKETASSENLRPRGAKGARASGARTEVASQPAQPSSPQRIFSTDFGSRGAEDLTAAGARNSYTDAGPVISVRMPSPKAGQLRLEDGQGTKRTLSPVSFGGQESIERPDKARLVPASEKGIW
jgi:hypothetical protein